MSSEFAGLTTFEHWPIRTAKWIGEFDPMTATYSSINEENIKHALKVIEAVVKKYAGHPAVLGLEPVNEPWQYTPIETLKRVRHYCVFVCLMLNPALAHSCLLGSDWTTVLLGRVLDRQTARSLLEVHFP